YQTRELATAEIDEYIETFYNRTRRHSHLSGVSPETFEAVSNRA
ncbi:MAG TPA: IS3 family transposase, partial [Nitrospiraceae bacterium]|nr:IS3 family transposase [Nitrospiraceae bacterium]